MRRQLERAREESSGWRAYLLATYYFITGNYSLMTILFGLGMIVFGATLLSGRPEVVFEVVNSLPRISIAWLEHGIFAGMFGVWGASLVLIGGVAYSVMWLNKLYARYTDDTGSESEPESETDIDSNTI